MELKMFYQPGCPYCRQAENVISRLTEAEPALASVRIRRVDETAERALAEQYDYWHVPSFFLGERKLYEAQPGDSAEKMERIIGGILREAAKP